MPQARASVVELQRRLGNRTLSRLARRSTATPAQGPAGLDIVVELGAYVPRRTSRMLQRLASIDVRYDDATEPADDAPIGVRITGSVLAPQGRIDSPEAAGPAARESRHIVPNALAVRSVQAEFDRKPASFFKAYPGSAPNPRGFRERVKGIVQARLRTVHEELNLKTGLMPQVGVFDFGAVNEHRNYWLGDKAENQTINREVTTERAAVDREWRDQPDGSPEYVAYKASTDARNRAWLAKEFDPPPGKSVAAYQQMGEAWATFIRRWFDNDDLARRRYQPSDWAAGGPSWEDAFKWSPANQRKLSAARAAPAAGASAAAPAPGAPAAAPAAPSQGPAKRRKL